MELSYDKSKVKVLICDDEDSIRDMLALTLRDDGWTVETAANGKIGAELLEKQKFHIVMSDINMPEMTGMELLEHIKKTQPHIEFLIMTSHATLETAVNAVKLGAYDYLNKPFDDLSIVPKKLEVVAEKILLRQQNQELLRRLKGAGQDLRRLVNVITNISGLLDKEGLREATLKGFSEIFSEENVKASWWTRTADSWKLHSALPNAEDFSGIHFPDEAVEKLDKLRNPRVHYFEYQNQRKEAVIFESLKESLADLYLQQVSLCYQKSCFHSDIAGLVNKDGLTRIYNHRYFQERLQQEVSQAKRQKSFVSLILMDVDHFKNYNDTNGHPAGDELLRKLAELLNKHQNEESDAPSKRETDIVARYGGEEFVMILPFTPHDGAIIKAERIREAVENFPFAHREDQPLGKISISVGVATFPVHAQGPADLVEAADKALYAAKKSGRNQVKSFDKLSKAETEEVKAKETPQQASKTKAATLENILEEKEAAVEENQVEEIQVLETPSNATEELPRPAAFELKASKERKFSDSKKSLKDLQEQRNPLKAEIDIDISSLVDQITKAVDEAEPLPSNGDFKAFQNEEEVSAPQVAEAKSE